MKEPRESLNKPLLWENKPVLHNPLLIWDVENISIQALSFIKHIAKFTPQRCFAISKKQLDDEKETLLVKEGFSLYVSYPRSSDATIVDMIDRHHHCSYLIFISSDGDFVPVIKRFLQKHLVQWIMQDCNKKRICMNIALTHPNLTLSTIDIIDKHHTKDDTNKNRKPAFYAPSRASFYNEAYWLTYFARYHAHIG